MAAQTCSNSFRQRTNQRRARVKGGHAALHACPSDTQNTAQGSSKPLWALPAQFPDHSAQLDAKQLVPRKNPPEIRQVRSHFAGSFLTSRHRSNPLGAAQLMLGAAHGNSDARKLVPSKNPPEI